MENKRGMLDRFSWFMASHRLAVLIISVLVALGLGYKIPKIKSQINLPELFPYDHEYLKLSEKFGKVFGAGFTGSIIVMKAENGDIFNERTLTKLKTMTEEVEMWDEVYRVLTASIASRSIKAIKALGKGEIRIEALMWPNIPKNDKEMAALKQSVFSSPAYNGTFVSRDGTAAILLTEFREEDLPKSFGLLRGLVDKYGDEETSIHIVGVPMMMGWFYSYMPNIILVSLISIGFMILILLIIFRNVAGTFTPVSFSFLCTLMGLGFIGWTQINFSPLLYVLAFVVGARMLSHSVQITHRYFEEYENNNEDKTQACYETIRKMLIPNWAGVITDAAGFLVLLMAKIVLMQNVAIMMSFWMI